MAISGALPLEAALSNRSVLLYSFTKSILHHRPKFQ